MDSIEDYKTNISHTSPFGRTDEIPEWLCTIIATLKAVERNISQCIYVLDWPSKEIIYTSTNLAKYCKLPAMPPGCYVKYENIKDTIPEGEMKMINEANRALEILIMKMKPQDLLQCTMSCDFHMKSEARMRMMHHKLTPLTINKDGNIGLAVATICTSASGTAGNFFLSKIEWEHYYKYSTETHEWVKREKTMLSELESDILRLAAQGYTVEEIADKLAKSTNTIKAAKRCLFSRMGVNNISQALLAATLYKKM